MPRIKNITLGLAMTTASMLGMPSFGQHTKKIISNTKTELLQSIPDDVADYPIAWVEKHYDHQKTIELVHQNILKQINEIRVHHGVKPLVLDSLLCSVSQHYAQEMDKNKRYNHIGADGSTPMKRGLKEKYHTNIMLENIGRNYFSITDAVQHRKNSPSHFENMIDPDVNQLGIGYYNGSRVNMFGCKPKED